MPDPEDILDISGLTRIGGQGKRSRQPQPRRFLSVWYRCCHTYGRLYRNRDETAFVGRCPRCGAQVQALIGPNGTNRTMFEAR